jgi:hypothetical protein
LESGRFDDKLLQIILVRIGIWFLKNCVCFCIECLLEMKFDNPNRAPVEHSVEGCEEEKAKQLVDAFLHPEWNLITNKPEQNTILSIALFY